MLQKRPILLGWEMKVSINAEAVMCNNLSVFVQFLDLIPPKNVAHSLRLLFVVFSHRPFLPIIFRYTGTVMPVK